MTEQLANSLQDPTTTLSGSITSVDTSLTVVDPTELPATGDYRIRIGTELILVGARSGDVLSSLTRGIEGTSAAAHAGGANVDLVLTAGGLTAFVTDPANQPGVALATTTLTNAQILALPLTPITVVTAQAGKSIFPILPVILRGTIAVDYGNLDATAAWSFTGGAQGGGTGFFVDIDPNISAPVDVVKANAQGYTTAPTQYLLAWNSVQAAQAAVTTDNQPLLLNLSNGVLGALTGGNSANSLTVIVPYVLL